MYSSGLPGMMPSPRAISIALTQSAASAPELAAFHAEAMAHGAQAREPVSSVTHGGHVPGVTGSGGTGSGSGVGTGTGGAGADELPSLEQTAFQMFALPPHVHVRPGQQAFAPGEHVAAVPSLHAPHQSPSWTSGHTQEACELATICCAVMACCGRAAGAARDVAASAVSRSASLMNIFAWRDRILEIWPNQMRPL